MIFDKILVRFRKDFVELRITRNQLILCALSKEGSELEGNTPNYAKVTKAKPK